MVLRPVATTHCKAAGLRSSHSILRSHKARLGNLQKGLKCSSFHAYHQLLAPASSHSSPAVLQHHSFVLSSKSLLHTRRSASTVTRPPSTISPSPAAGVASDETRLTWNRFLQLRAVRRRFNIVASIISATGTVALGASVLTSIDLDTFSAHLPFGLDPIFALGLFTLGCGALGWLLGPFAGNAAFGWYYRGLRKEITMKEKEFYHRIQRHRADPSGQSVSNPVPDYYGEKISSLTGYRQWLKDQRAFKKKREGF